VARGRCPRCGEYGTIVYRRYKEGKTYVYYVHKRGGKQIWHYAGPLEEYEYVSRLHPLEFYGPERGEARRLCEYILKSLVSLKGLVSEGVLEAQEEVGELRRAIREARRLIEELEKMLG